MVSLQFVHVFTIPRLLALLIFLFIHFPKSENPAVIHQREGKFRRTQKNELYFYFFECTELLAMIAAAAAAHTSGIRHSLVGLVLYSPCRYLLLPVGCVLSRSSSQVALVECRVRPS